MHTKLSLHWSNGPSSHASMLAIKCSMQLTPNTILSAATESGWWGESVCVCVHVCVRACAWTAHLHALVSSLSDGSSIGRQHSPCSLYLFHTPHQEPSSHTPSPQTQSHARTYPGTWYKTDSKICNYYNYDKISYNFDRLPIEWNLPSLLGLSLSWYWNLSVRSPPASYTSTHHAHQVTTCAHSTWSVMTRDSLDCKHRIVFQNFSDMESALPPPSCV